VPAHPRVTSRQHAFVRRCRAIAARRGDAGGLVLLDGEHLLTEALAAGVPIEGVLTDGRGAEVAARARETGAPVYSASGAVLAAASPVKHASGLVTLARWAPAPLARALDGRNPLVVGLVDVQDPGNLGGAIRAAAGLDATGVVALDRSADPGGWRAMRGAMGSAFRIPVARAASSDLLAEARRRGCTVAATAAGAGEPIDRADLRGPLLILLGNEGAGLPADLAAQADVILTVPTGRGVESLNVAVTAALVLFEARRQRAGVQP
jgi:TrmH family RNA methyltransferase